MKNGGEPDEVLQSQIWRFAGEILKEVPGPVQVAEAVHTLMGRQPPIQDPLNSPVQQVSERQARTSEALNAISQTAQAVRQQQQSQGAQQQRSADPQSSNFASQVLQRPHQELQVDIAQQMQAAMATAACSDDAYLSAEQRSMRQMAVQMATACMAPVLQVMKQRDEAHQAEVRQLTATVASMSGQLQRMESKVDSNASFYPLMSLAMAQLSQQTHGLAQCLSASFRSGAANPGLNSPAASPRQPLATPQRKQLQRQDNARTKAKKQLLQAQGQNAQPVLSRAVTSALRIVYPGSAGEVSWCSWQGR